MVRMNSISKEFNRFAEHQAKTSSTLYYFWSKKIAQDVEMLKMIAKIPETQPKPNLFFASVQYVLSNKDDVLKKYVPSFIDTPLPIEDSYIALKEFVEKYHTEIAHHFHTKYVQTNEVRRCTYLYPIFSEIAHKVQKPLALVEIGTSAGLLLNIDQYHYEIKQGNETVQYGNPTSEVNLKSENLGKHIENCPNFQVSARYGIDLNIINLDHEEDYLWMQSLIWPEHVERRQLFHQSAKVNHAINKTLLEGDLFTILPSIFRNSTDEQQIVLFHTHVANQFSEEVKENYQQLLLDLSKEKSIYHVYNNMYDTDLHVDYVDDGHIEQIKLLQMPDGHGKYFYWS